MSNHPNVTRRRFLMLGSFGAGVIVDHALGVPVERFVNEFIFPEPGSEYARIGSAVKELMSGSVPELSLGGVNAVARSRGKPSRPSNYTLVAGQALNRAIQDSFGFADIREVKAEDSLVPYGDIRHGILLGGPYSHPDAARDQGYEFTTRDSKMPGVFHPTPRKDFSLPYVLMAGETTRGELPDGTLSTARRYEDGDVVERARFALRRLRDNQLIRCGVDQHGFLENEYLQVIRLKRDTGTKIFMWGLHGNSLAGFFKDAASASSNLDKLVGLTEGDSDFQVVLPFELTHDHSKKQTYANPVWEEVGVEFL